MARKMVQIRVNQSGVDWLDHLADKHEVSRSDVVRACLAIARQQPALMDKTISGTKERM